MDAEHNQVVVRICSGVSDLQNIMLTLLSAYLIDSQDLNTVTYSMFNILSSSTDILLAVLG